MTEHDARIIGQALLEQFPEFIQHSLVEDSEFRRELGVTLSHTMSLAGGVAVFERTAFLRGVARHHEEPAAAATLADTRGVLWRMECVEHADRPVVTLSNGERTFRLIETPGLKPTADARLRDFDRALQVAGLAGSDLAHWRSTMSERKLEDDEVWKLEQSLLNTPTAISAVIGDALRSSANVDSLIPADLEYWHRLCGTFEAHDLQELTTLTASYAAELIAGRGVNGARQALFLASEGRLLLGSGIGDLPAEVLIALAEELKASGDLLSKVAFVEVALEAVERVPDLVASLVVLIEEVVGLAPGPRSGALWMLTALIVLVDGQLGHLKIFEGQAPLRRRQAAIAHASLIAMRWPPEVDPNEFVAWALEARNTEFYFQTLVDLQREPRWSSEHVAPEQLKNEFVSRLYNAGSRHAELIKDTALAPLLQGRGEGSLLSQMKFPGSFLPGPLEGAQPMEPHPPPSEVEQVVEEQLAMERLSAGALASLINIRGLFNVGDDKIKRLMALIEKEGFRLPSDAKPEQANGLLLGLAGLAATTRSPALADQVRIMMRRRRVDGLAMNILEELGVVLTCAAARCDRKDWAEAIDEWVSELALSTTDREQAIELHDHLLCLCLISPHLRGSIGPSIAALHSFLLI